MILKSFNKIKNSNWIKKNFKKSLKKTGRDFKFFIYSIMKSGFLHILTPPAPQKNGCNKISLSSEYTSYQHFSYEALRNIESEKEKVIYLVTHQKNPLCLS